MNFAKTLVYRFSVVLPILLNLASCVSLSEHDRLQKRLEQTELRLQQTNTQLQAKDQAQKKMRDYLNQKSDENSDLSLQLASMKSRDKAREEELSLAAQQNSKLAKTLADKELALASASRSKEEQELLLAQYNKQLKDLIAAGDLSVSLVNGKLVVTLPSDILFATGSAKVSERGQNTIQELGQVFLKMRERRLQVEGHTDDVPIRRGRFDSNWHLGHGRAMAIIDLLLKAGVAGSQLSAASYGEFQPKVPNTDESSRQGNRRIEIVIIPDLSVLTAH